MGMPFPQPVTGAGGVLVIPAIHTPNYVPGVSGWSANQDGSAEFSDLTLRGVFQGTDYEINASGAFFYSGTPAPGNLIASVTNVAGTDGFGNAYLAGVTSYASGGTSAQNSAGGNSGWYTSPGPGGPWTLQAQLTAYSSGQFWLTAVGISAAVIGAFAPGSGNTIPETTHALGSMSNGWSITGHASYWLGAEGELWLILKDIVPGTTITDGTVIWSAANGLPAGYRPASNRRILCYSTGQTGNVGGTAFELETDGSIQCYGFTRASTGRADLYAQIPISV